MVTTEEPALDFAQAVGGGYAIVEAVVDGFDRGSVEQFGHLAEVDSVLDDVGLPLSLVPLEGHCRSMWLDGPTVSIHL